MMKKLLLFALLLSSGPLLKGQVLLKPNLPPAGITLKSQLWHFSLLNTSAATMEVQVELLLINAANNQKVLSATTRSLTLPRGLSPFTPAGVAPVIYNVLSPGYPVGVGQDDFLPVGVYEVCYQVKRFNGDVEERLAEQCESIEVEPLSPPLLQSPANGEELEVIRPLFQWLPPAPLTLFTGLTYEFRLVEVHPVQSPSIALQQNLPLFQHSLSTAMLPYPAALPSLDTARTYAWQVAARSAGSGVAHSEIWTFRIKRNGAPPATAGGEGFYARLKKEQDAAFVLTSGAVRYAYTNELNDAFVTLKVFDITTPRHKELKLSTDTATLRYGENYRELDLPLRQLSAGRKYLLQLTNSRKEHWYLRFEYRQPK